MSRGTSLARGGANSAAPAREALAAVCARGISARALGAELRPRLRRLVAFDAYCLNICDTESGVVTSSNGDGLSPDQARALFALEAQGGDLNTLHALRRGPVHVASLGLSTGGHPERSQRMREIFLPLGFGDELRAALTTSDRVCYGYVHLFRRQGEPLFGAADVNELALASPVVARALRAAALASVPGAAPGGAAQRKKPSLIVVDADDRVVQQSADAEALLAAQDTLRAASGLAHVLRDVASRSRRGGDAQATLLTAHGERLAVSAVQLGADTAIVLAEPSVRQAQASSLAAYALTPREREVSRLVAAGQSNQSIAGTLRISVHTVKDHVKAVLTKTGSATRTELAARLRGV